METSRHQPTLTIIAAISRGLGITTTEFDPDLKATMAMAKDVPGPE